MFKQVDILGVPISDCTLQSAAETIIRCAENNKQTHVITANSEIVYAAHQDARLLEVADNASIITADGIGVVMASRILGTPLPERVTGYDLLLKICSLAAQKGVRIFLLGAKPGIAQAARAKLEHLYSGIQIVGVQHGYFNETEEEGIVDKIREAKPHVLFVALGAPQAEFWIAKWHSEIGVPVAMGVGGTLDGLAGAVKRAPVFWQKAGLEWAYRIIKEPRRAGRAMALPKFALLVLKKRMGL